MNLKGGFKPMKPKVKLADIVDGMEAISYDNRVLINSESGEIVFILGEFLSKAEDEKPFDHMPEWQQEMMKLAHEIINHEDRYIALPEEYEVNDYEIMESFCYTVTDPNKEDALLISIRGRGAFRRFKDLIYELGLAGDWYDYRDEAYKQIAKEFCEDHDIRYEE